MSEVLTRQQAFSAMFQFLTDHHQQTGSEEVAALLGSCALLSDGQTADPAIWQDWSVACDRALGGNVKMSLELRNGGISK
ncbi:hypothetical protein [Labrenzia sp. VG12]|uniref:hypothetical protein n=1 Tax=Labrenzia sp. VG12 TaxID=2021862 RepID=UPI000B8C2535|nr:hypothetical protein [Labrenzia sp. VG12]ASP36229.1 hypothetical protein CHH27_25730 [Labrenzia sp. VG12]